MKFYWKALTVSLALVTCAPLASAAEFSDLASGHPHYEAIQYLADTEVLNGYEDGTFKPGALVNRAEAVKIIANAFGVDTANASNKNFSDVAASDWFFPYVMGAVDTGIVQGYEDGSFKPGQTVNLAETLKMLTLATDASLPTVEFDVFVDVPKDQWYASYALYAREKNIVLADDYGQIYPGQDITRGMMAEVVYRLKYMRDEGLDNYPLATNWPVYSSAQLPFKMKYDESWDVVSSAREVSFFKSDVRYGQFSAERIFPNSAKVVVTLDLNEENKSRSEYFENIKKAFPDAAVTEFDLRGMEGMELLFDGQRIVDWYLYLDTGMVLAVYTEYGDGLLKLQLPKIIGEMLLSLEFHDVEVNFEDADLLETILKNVLVENVGMQMIEILPDERLFDTDTIGVGTGPVDYYYSAELNRTFKYERAADMILAVSEGETSAF